MPKILHAMRPTLFLRRNHIMCICFLLPQADFLRSIFIALNDESCGVRALTIQLVSHREGVLAVISDLMRCVVCVHGSDLLFRVR